MGDGGKYRIQHRSPVTVTLEDSPARGYRFDFYDLKFVIRHGKELIVVTPKTE